LTSFYNFDTGTAICYDNDIIIIYTAIDIHVYFVCSSTYL
jgi:hypothetical protein